MKETHLYLPVKEFFADLGYTVRAEVEGCDLVACRGDEVVIVELKTRMNLTLILQGVDRQRMSDAVYLAVPAPKRRSRWNEVVRLCRMLGLGLLAVTVRKRSARVDVVCEPGPYSPRTSSRRRRHLLKEFSDRSGDYNVGGSAGRPLVTAYREEALRVASFLNKRGPTPLGEIRESVDSSRVGPILQKNYYGWFVRVSRGVYRLTSAGERALEEYREVVEAFRP